MSAARYPTEAIELEVPEAPKRRAKLSEKKRQRFEVKPLYRVSELAAIVGMSKWAMARLLRRHGVDITLGGRGQPAMVTLIAIRVGLPDVWESILLAKALDRG